MMMNRYLYLEARKENWGLIHDGLWSSIAWSVYSDGTYSVRIGFVPEQNPSDYIETKGKMRRDRFARLWTAVEQDWTQDEIEAGGCDGEAWELKQFSQEGSIVRCFGLGYIYEDGMLGQITSRLPGKMFIRDHI